MGTAIYIPTVSSDGGHMGAEGVASPGLTFGRNLPPLGVRPSAIAVSNRIEGCTGLVLPAPGRGAAIPLALAVRRIGICAAQKSSGRRNDSKCRHAVPHGDLLPGVVLVAERRLLYFGCIVGCETARAAVIALGLRCPVDQHSCRVVDLIQRVAFSIQVAQDACSCRGCRAERR